MEESDPTVTERACFETGIKFGSLYHQFAGTPVSPGSAASLERAMTEAIENQPHCESVRVDIDTAAVATDIENSTATYTELTGRFLDVAIRVEYEGTVVEGTMELTDGYPLMAIESVERA